ncbi:hypothetical protein D3C87_1411750 [compost metagenome]
MKQHFENKTFSDELDIWNYLQVIKETDLFVPDGYYCIELMESEVGIIRFRCVIKTSDRKQLRNILYDRPRYNPRCYIYVKGQKTFCVGVDSAYLEAHDEIEAHGRWELAFYNDYLNMPPPMKFTADECAAACDALVELLIMNSKKVS